MKHVHLFHLSLFHVVKGSSGVWLGECEGVMLPPAVGVRS